MELHVQIFFNFVSECTNLILTNAKEKKQEWRTKLTAMELDNLCSYRDALVAQGVFLNMIAIETDANHKRVTEDVSACTLFISLATLQFCNFLYSITSYCNLNYTDQKG